MSMDNTANKIFESEVYCVNLPYIFENFYPMIIPSYQRGYAWDDENINDLISDIEDTEKSESYEHFIGTVVLISNTQNEQGYYIIDGQQRLTSFFILMKSIYDKIHNDSILSTYIKFGEKSDYHSKLTTQETSENYLEEFIVHDEKNLDELIYSHQRIKKAKEIFDKWLFSKSNKDIENIKKVIEQKMKFIVYTPKDSLNASAMFEVINNRGKSLSELEKIKNYFVYIATILGKDHELHKTIETKWSKILQNLNYADIHTLDDENSFLRYCFITYFSAAKTKYQKIYMILKNEFFPIKYFLTKNDGNKEEIILKAKKIEKIDGFIRFMSKASKYYICLKKPKNIEQYLPKEDKGIIKYIKYIACHTSVSSIVPLYLYIMTNDKMENSDKIELLDYLEKLNFRMYVLPDILTRSDNAQSKLYMLANSLYNKEDSNIKENINFLKEELKEIVEYWSPLKKIEEALTLENDEYYDFAHWNGLRYFLARYEEKLEEEKNRTFDVTQIIDSRKDCKTGDYLSVEHIWARKNRTEYANEDCKAKRRLGNFVLLELNTNIAVSNEDISEKLKKQNENDTSIEERVSIIENTNLLQCRNLAKIYKDVSKNMEKWKRKTKGYYLDLGNTFDDVREEKLIEFAKKTWRFPGEKIKETK